MRLEAVLGIDTLNGLVKELMPLQILLGEESGAAYLVLHEPNRVALVKDAGLRVSCKARLSFPVLGVALPISLNALTVLLSPVIAKRDGREALVFQVEIQHIDLAGFPALLDAHMLERINRVLADRKIELAWDFTRTLSYAFSLPPPLGLVDVFELRVLEGKVAIDESTMRLAIAFAARITRAAGT